MKRVVVLWFALSAAIFAGGVQAHEVRPAYLELRQTAPETYDLLFKVPALGEDLRLALYVTLPAAAQDVVAPHALFSGGAYVERRTIRCTGGLSGASIGVEGLSATFTDVLVRIQYLGGAVQTERLTPTKASFVVKPAPSIGEVAATYLQLGVEHILGGVDHLLFVLGLLLLVKGGRRIFLTITAFTVAHSITLAAATLGYVSVPGPPVEAAIALSIVFVAAEIVNVHRGRPSLTARWPWLVAFTFGLLHGLGFAGALSEVGLPAHAIPLALLFFNLGVETGQLIFVAAVMAVVAAVERLTTRRWKLAGEQLRFGQIEVACAYGIGSVATYWLADRTMGFWT
jgi:hydrogenase/urease accessory protein HupE